MNPYYQRDNITIYRGDSNELLAALPKESFDTIIFDPPFTATEERIYTIRRWLKQGGKLFILGPRHYTLYSDGVSDFVEMPQLEPRAEFSHYASRPVAAMEELIRLSEGIILDPFMGVGSTLLAAKHLGRAAIGIEITAKYCLSAVARLEL